MSSRTRNLLLLYALILLASVALLALIAHADPKDPKPPKGHSAVFEPGTWPAPVFAGGAMPVQWTDIPNPTAWDWFGLFPPEALDGDYPLEFAYVSCTQIGGVVVRATGICGFVVPSTVPPGTYEIRLYSGIGTGYTRLAKSPKFDVLDGGFGQ